MLLNNYSILNRNVATQNGNQFTNPMSCVRASTLPNFYCGEHVVAGETNKSAFNNGYNTIELGGYAWWLSPKAGGIGANRFSGSGSLVSSVAGGVNGVAPLSGSGDITQAQADLIVSAIASLIGSGDISSAVVNAVLPAIAALSGSGDISSATITALADAIASLSGSGSISTTIYATGQLDASIVVTGDALSTANVASAVWDAFAEAGFTYAQCIQIIAAACAAKTSNTGQTFRDLSDTKDRIVGTVSGGERTAVTYDVD